MRTLDRPVGLWHDVTVMVCMVEFFGGPAHGKVFAIPGSEPPHVYTLPVKEHGVRGVAIYERQVSSLDEGTFWVMVYKEAA